MERINPEGTKTLLTIQEYKLQLPVQSAPTQALPEMIFLAGMRKPNL
jgi:hypothetical protein